MIFYTDVRYSSSTTVLEAYKRKLESGELKRDEQQIAVITQEFDPLYERIDGYVPQSLNKLKSTIYVKIIVLY